MVINRTPAITIRRRFGFVSSRVVLGAGCAGSTVVGAVGRLMLASVLCSRTLVSISLDTEPELNFAVPASALTELESVTRGVPSARQNASASSVSTLLHAGQRFIFHGLEFNLQVVAFERSKLKLELVV